MFTFAKTIVCPDRRTSSYSMAFLVVICFAANVRADVVAVSASQDTTLFSESDDLSNGAGDFFFAGRNNLGNSRRGMISFDVAAVVPVGSIINSVQLTLYMSRSKQGTDPVALHRVETNWGEGASHADAEEGAGISAEDNDATWRYTFYSTADPPSSPAWSSLGGDFSATVSVSIPVGSDGQAYTWGSTAQMVADVQFWLDSPGSNYGWILLGDETSNRTAAQFKSRTNGDTSDRPALSVTFTPPASTGACCFTDGSCLVQSSSDCNINNGTYQGDGAVCTPNPCPQPTGACCFTDGSCLVQTSPDCNTNGGSYQGDGTDCTPNPCPIPIGACCFDDGTCQELILADCTTNGGAYQGASTTCTPDLCPINLVPFVDALPLPAPAQPTSGSVGGTASYTLAMRQVQQQLHRDLPPTTVWAYGDGPTGAGYPGPTIEAAVDQPVTITWLNDLRDDQGALRTDHYLTVDLCPHGAADLPKTVVHLHGGHVPPEADGYPEDTFMPGASDTYVYPNNQLPATLWYHDHALGITRLNVYMGLAAFYLLRDTLETSLDLPAGEYEIPLVFQDRQFHSDGSWKYPAVWQDSFFGDKVLVNGKVWPYHNVKQGKYRLRMLNGSNSRTYTLTMSPATPFNIIGTDGGLLAAPVTVSEITMGPAERVDAIVDFSGFSPGQEVLLVNSAPSNYPGTPGVGVIPDIMKFVVQGDPGFTNAIPSTLRPMEQLQEADAVLTRDFELRKSSDPCTGSEWLINGLGWDDITEYPRLGTTEIWRFINRSGMSHPMHMHLVMFQVLDREGFDVVDDQIVPLGNVTLPTVTESGWKDTVMAHPQEITRIIVRFEDYAGLFAYHCHILEHEDHEMMRQFFAASFGDAEPDADVDLADHAVLADCLSGPGQAPQPTLPTTVQNCLDAFDTDFDGDVDLDDAGDVFDLFTGP